MAFDRKIFQAVMVIFFMLLFGYFAGNKLTAFSALLAAAIFMYISAREHGSPVHLLGLASRGNNPHLWIMAGVTTSSILAFYYRFHYSETLLPGNMSLVALAAPLIGMTEEMIYRGVIQGTLSHRHPVTGILVAATGHTAYKAILLGSSPVAGMINMTALVVLTFLTGSLFGYFRYRSGQIYSPLLAHGLFDILVYGDQAGFPVWVWH